MNVRTLPLSAALLLAVLSGCIQERDTSGIDTDTSPPVDSGAGDDTATESDDGDNDGREDGIDDPATADGATLRLHQSIAPAGLTVTTEVETGAYAYGGGFGGDAEAGEDDWCDTDRPMGYDDGYWELYLPAGDYLLNAGRYQACSSDSFDTWFNLEGEAMASDPWLYRLENGDGYALCIHSDGEKLTTGNWSVCNTLDDVSREERESDPYDGEEDEEDVEDEDDGDDSGSGSSDLTREVCVDNVTGDFDLGYLLMGDSGDTSHWVSDNGSTAVVSSPLLTESDSDGCATIELNHAGEQVKFNGWAENSTYWHEYFVGTGSSGYCSGSTCAVGQITVDGEAATISGMDLVWSD